MKKALVIGKSVNPKILHPIQFLPAICNTPRETLLLIGDVGGVEAHWSQLIQPAVCAADFTTIHVV
ncbi:unnamed protein product [Cladocopium goreaui]|uniref:Uncharacterized protein n=1 Tax=Cladocopium goreaui TaxID=2562237 RepID=A0A9P1FHR0_9DINO|nr:unnamed protein product [Cladocopium goreaui]